MACKTVTISEGRKRLLELADEAKETLETYQTPGLADELKRRAGDRSRIKARTHAQVWGQ